MDKPSNYQRADTTEIVKTTHPKPDRAAEAEAHEFMRRILYPLGLTQTAFPDRDKEMARVTGIIVEVITAERERSRGLLEALKLVLERYGHSPQRIEPEEIFTARAAIAAYKGEK